jgi:hypothetical protein
MRKQSGNYVVNQVRNYLPNPGKTFPFLPHPPFIVFSDEHQESRRANQTYVPPARSAPRLLARSTSRAAHRPPPASALIPRRAPAPLAPEPRLIYRLTLLAFLPHHQREQAPRTAAPLWRGRRVILPFLLLAVASVIVLAILTDPVVRPFFRLV